MFRRSVTILVAAAALALAPAAAFGGYGGDDYSNKGTVSDTTPDIGQQFTVTAAGPSNTNVTLTITSAASIPDSAITIAGTKALTKATSATGAVSFPVTLNAAGTYTLVLTDTATGAVLSSQVVTVAAAAAAAAAASGLATTGSNFALFGFSAGALILLGSGAIVLARRRQGHSA
jgi:hypothetical protein